MNNRQRRVVAFAGAWMALMLLVPPFHEVSGFGREGESLGYHLVGMAPEDGSINVTALVIQLLAAVIFCSGLWWATREK